MKRKLLFVLLLIFTSLIVYGQAAQSIDLILLLDTSTGMSSSYENVNNYITGSFLTEFLRTGDTFHLIAFSSTPRLDSARRVTSRGDIETIIGRMLLQYPIESASNIGSAISYAEQYTASLPARPKKIVLVSSGATDTSALVNAARQRLSARNATIDFVQVTPGQPLANLPVSGRPALRTSTAAQTATSGTQPGAQTSTQTTTQPATSGAQPSTQTTTQPGAQTGTTAASGTQPGTQAATSVEERSAAGDTVTDTAAGQAQTDTTALADGTEGARATDDSIEPSAVTGDIIAGDQAETAADRFPWASRRPGEGIKIFGASLPAIIGVIILLLLILGIIIFMLSRRLGSSPNRVMAEVASGGKEDPPFVDHSKDLARYAAVQNRQRTTPYTDRPVKQENVKPVAINPSGPLLLNLFVEDQSIAIGKRNIHSLKSGYGLSVGGGKSDFLIFLVPIPQNIGELRRKGSQLTFIPRKPKYFPDLGSNELRDCLNKTIRIISDKNYELRFRFEMYEDPLISLNRMLHSIKVPG